MKRVLICGDRNYTHTQSIKSVIDDLPSDCLVIAGACRGADMIAAQCARQRDLLVHEKPADWNRYGRAAGPIRNREMLVELLEPSQNPLDQVKVIAFHDHIEDSKGTSDMIRQALKANVPVELRKSDGSYVLIES